MKRKAVSLDEMVAALKSAHGDNLRSVVLYGSAASTDSAGVRADYNLLILVEEVRLPDLLLVSDTVDRWTGDGNPPPLTFTRAEWEASADIFPMEYCDVLESHKELFGSLDVAHPRISTEHLRLQLEQETMGKLLWLRQGATIAGSNAAAQTRLLEGAFSKLLVLCRGLLRLHGMRPPAQRDAVITQAAATAGLDGRPLLYIGQSVAKEAPHGAAVSHDVLAGTLALLEQLASHINTFRPPSPTYVAARAGAQTGEKQK